MSSPDFFSFLGLARKLNIDTADLEQRYRVLSRQFHPDYFYNAPPAERRASLERSSYLNDAYRTLRNTVSRIEYLLKVEGAAPEGPDFKPGAPGRSSLIDPTVTGTKLVLTGTVSGLTCGPIKRAPEPRYCSGS